jgi:hypothetical protein
MKWIKLSVTDVEIYQMWVKSYIIKGLENIIFYGFDWKFDVEIAFSPVCWYNPMRLPLMTQQWYQISVWRNTIRLALEGEILNYIIY